MAHVVLINRHDNQCSMEFFVLMSLMGNRGHVPQGIAAGRQKKKWSSQPRPFVPTRPCSQGGEYAWVEAHLLGSIVPPRTSSHWVGRSNYLRTWWIRRLLFINLSDTIESSAYNNPYRIAFSVTEARVPSGHLKSLEKFVHSEVMVYNICILCDASSFLYPPKFIVLQTIRLNVVRLWWWIVFN